MSWLLALLPAVVGIASAVAAVRIARAYRRRLHAGRTAGLSRPVPG